MYQILNRANPEDTTDFVTFTGEMARKHLWEGGTFDSKLINEDCALSVGLSLVRIRKHKQNSILEIGSPVIAEYEVTIDIRYVTGLGRWRLKQIQD